MLRIGVVANGPKNLIPNLSDFRDVDLWIGADKGALTILENNLVLAYALGDFDSVKTNDLMRIKDNTKNFEQFPIEKDQTDMEIAIEKALSLKPNKVYVFGATGGRIDHMLMNIQLLETVVKKNIEGVLIDNNNKIELTYPGTYTLRQDDRYPTISFIPLTPEVIGLTLSGFYYPLTNETIKMGSSLSISNQLISNIGTFSYTDGIVLVVRSHD